MTPTGAGCESYRGERRLSALVEELQVVFPQEFWPVVWLTGGTVRDALLGRQGQDIDLAAAVPEELLGSLSFRHVLGRSTAPVWLRHDKVLGGIEITRLDAPAGILADLRRRDFTMNAMAVSLHGEMLDPLSGRSDLEQGVIAACSGNAFSKDPLRIFRAFRFAAEGFTLAAGLQSMLEQEGWDDLLEQVPVERFSRELAKALAAPQPEQFFLLMIRYNVGRIFLPELFLMAGVPAGPPEYHPEGDLLSHSVQVLQRVAVATPDPLARFSAFFHDIGKLATAPDLYPRHHGHEDAGAKAAGEFCRRLRLPLSHGRALSLVSRLHGKANRLATLRTATGIGLAVEAIKGGVDGILPLVSAADSPGGMDVALWQRLLDVARMTTMQLGIDRERLLLVPAGKRGAMITQRRVELFRSLGSIKPDQAPS